MMHGLPDLIEVGRGHEDHGECRREHLGLGVLRPKKVREMPRRA
jgi:hypothetical protein